MFLPWLTGGIAALDLFIKDEIEREGTEEFPRDLPGTKGFIRIHKSYNPGFPFGFMKERPQLVKGIQMCIRDRFKDDYHFYCGRDHCPGPYRRRLVWKAYDVFDADRYRV